MDKYLSDSFIVLASKRLDRKYVIVKTNSGYALTDGWLTDWIIVMDESTGKYVCDNILPVTRRQIGIIQQFIKRHKRITI